MRVGRQENGKTENSLWRTHIYLRIANEYVANEYVA